MNDSKASAEAKKKAAELIANDFKVDEKTEKKERVKIGFVDSVKNIGKGIGKFFTSAVTDENGKFSLSRKAVLMMEAEQNNTENS